MNLSPRFEHALSYATQIHAHQHRKETGIPYVSHLLAVSALVLEYGGSEEEAIGALLHDAGEDAGGAGRVADIRLRFGVAVADIVEGCSDTDVTPKPPWKERKVAYIAHVRLAPHSVRLVSAADKLHNARAILRDYRRSQDELWSRFNGGKEGTLWYYRSLVIAFREAGENERAEGEGELVEELDRTVSEIEKEAKIEPAGE